MSWLMYETWTSPKEWFAFVEESIAKATDRGYTNTWRWVKEVAYEVVTRSRHEPGDGNIAVAFNVGLVFCTWAVRILEAKIESGRYTDRETKLMSSALEEFRKAVREL